MRKLILTILWLPIALISNCEDSETLTSIAESPKPQYDGNNPDLSALELLNWYRQQALLTPLEKQSTDPTDNYRVRFDSILNSNCLEHLEYIHATGEFGHEQDTESMYYSVLGADAGRKSVLAKNVASLYDAIEFWMNSLYHRVPLLEPSLTTIGFSYLPDNSNPGKGYAAIDVVNGLDDTHMFERPVFFPPVDHRDFPTQFSVEEFPNPLPEGWEVPTGNFITIMFPMHDEVIADSISAKLSLVQGSALFAVDNAGLQSALSPTMSNVLYLVSEDSLEPESLYEVEVEVEVNGEQELFNWRFSTAAI